MKKRRKAALHNLGCKVNEYELEAMQELLVKAGYEIVPFEPGADVYVINTCTVTNIADRKSRQMLHRARKMNPQAIVVAAGCYVQTGQKILEADEAVDILLGNDRKQQIVQVLEQFEKLRESREPEQEHMISQVPVIAESRKYVPLSVSRTADRIRANIKITDGCNQFCSYCLIPYARGRVRSRASDEILQEIRILAERGYREFILTGIHISSYGTDLDDIRSVELSPLLRLLQLISRIPGVERIRLGSLEPGIMKEEFVRGLTEIPQLCPHFHLSLQSGCDTTLRRMNRRYTCDEYMEKCRLLRRYFPNPALTTDVIVGFPGETEEEFRISREFIEQIEFYETHIFKYSRRDGTRAAIMADQIEEAVKEARSAELLRLNRAQMRKYEQSMYGKTLEVLLEEEKIIEDARYLIGHSREYIPVAIPFHDTLAPGEIVSLPVTAHLQEHILGTVTIKPQTAGL